MFEPQVGRLLAERDKRLRLGEGVRLTSDRKLDVLSELAIDVDQRLAVIQGVARG
jgi:hypothetical protein